MTRLEILFICIVIIIVVCLISIWHASTHFHKVYYRLSSDKISKPVKFVVLSDLHDKKYGADNEKLLRAIQEEHPDGILIAGDMLTALEHRTEKVAEAFIRALAKFCPVYYGMGNHESKMKWNKEKFGHLHEGYIQDIKDAGAILLLNKACALKEENICIYGLDISKEYYKRLRKTPMAEDYVQQILGKADETSYNILLAHNPAYFDNYVKWNPDLVLSGHVHGGLVRLPLLGGVIAPSLELFPKFDGGKFTKDNTTMIVSRGLGFHSIEFRMWNPAEVVVLEIQPKEK